MKQTKIIGYMGQLDFEHGRIEIMPEGLEGKENRIFLYVTSSQMEGLKDIFFEQIKPPVSKIYIECTLDTSILEHFEVKRRVIQPYQTSRCYGCKANQISSPHCTKTGVSCLFVCHYTDSEGVKYKAVYKDRPKRNIFYWRPCKQKPTDTGIFGWNVIASQPYRETFDLAQEDLNRYAKKHGLKRIQQEEKK